MPTLTGKIEDNVLDIVIASSLESVLFGDMDEVLAAHPATITPEISPGRQRMSANIPPAGGASKPPAAVGMFTAESLPRILPFLVYMAFIVIGDLLARLGWTSDQLRYLYGVKVGAVLAVLLYYRRRYCELAAPRLAGPRLAGPRLAGPRLTSAGPSARTLAVAVAVASGLLVLVLWINLDAAWMTVGTSAGFDPRNDGRIDWMLVALRLFGAALVVPVMEELFWRSFLMRWIDSPAFLHMNPANTRLKAFLVTAVLFGFEHNLWLAGIVAGAVYSLLYMRSQTLWSPILAHAVTNGMLGLWIISTNHWTYW